MKTTYDIKDRGTGEVIYTAEIECADDASDAVKRGMAAVAAVRAGVSLSGANLRGARLSGANLRGADLRGANLSGANLSGADLRGANLSGANLRDARLRDADLSDADLSGADLSGADLRGANLRDANLSGANLIGARLSGAILSDAPVIEGIHKRVYDAATARPELFDMSTFAEGSGHGCGTAQCRAGWVIHVAGQAGLDLEARIGTPAAAMAIYLASDPERWKNEPLPDFYTTSNEALADMARMAGVTE